MGDENAQQGAVSIAEPAPIVALMRPKARAEGDGQDGHSPAVNRDNSGDTATSTFTEAEALFHRGLLERVHMMGGRMTLYRPIMPKLSLPERDPGRVSRDGPTGRESVVVPEPSMGSSMAGPTLATPSTTMAASREFPLTGRPSRDLTIRLIPPVPPAGGGEEGDDNDDDDDEETMKMKMKMKIKIKMKKAMTTTKKGGEGGKKRKVDDSGSSRPPTTSTRHLRAPCPSSPIMARGVYSVQPIEADMCYACGGLALESESYRRWIFCTVCAESFHMECAHGAPRPDHPIRQGWAPGTHIEWHWHCPNCRSCSICKVSGRERPILCCRLCHRSLCTVCDSSSDPSHDDGTEGSGKGRGGGDKDGSHEYYHQCSSCRAPHRCLNCLALLTCGEGKGQGLDAGANSCPSFLCPTCTNQSACPRCWVRYAADDYSQAMVGCSGCDSWIHAHCLGLTDEEYQTLGVSRKPYYCHACRKRRGAKMGMGRKVGDEVPIKALAWAQPKCYICQGADDQILPVHDQINLSSPLPTPFVHPSCHGGTGSGRMPLITNDTDPLPSSLWFRRGSLSIRVPAVHSDLYPEMIIRKDIPRLWRLGGEDRRPLGSTERPVLVMRLGFSSQWRPCSLRDLALTSDADRERRSSLSVSKLRALLRQWMDRTSSQLSLSMIGEATVESFLRTALDPEIIAYFKLLWARRRSSVSSPSVQTSSVSRTRSGPQSGPLTNALTASLASMLTLGPPQLEGSARVRTYQRPSGRKAHTFLAPPESFPSPPSSFSFSSSSPPPHVSLSPWRNTHRAVNSSSLRVGKSTITGWGLFTMRPLAAGARIIEYVGEQVGQMMADRREVLYSLLPLHRNDCYLFRLDDDRILDATRKGNLARFINHSCAPNCESRIEGRASHIVIYARHAINPGEELTYDYKLSREGVDDRVPCRCGATNCRGYMN